MIAGVTYQSLNCKPIDFPVIKHGLVSDDKDEEGEMLIEDPENEDLLDPDSLPKLPETIDDLSKSGEILNAAPQLTINE